MGKKRDEAKARFWQGAIREATRSGVSIRVFCRRRKLDVAQFYWWRRRLRIGRGVDEATLRSMLAVLEGPGC